MHETDVVIVGAGSAGAVLAARLSADPCRRVRLLDAGQAYAPGAVPSDLLDPAHVPGEPQHDWGYTATGNDRNPNLAVPRGKVLGGTSSINAAIAMRATVHDIVKWNMHAGDGWLPDDVEAAFAALEAASENGSPDGLPPWLPIHQLTYRELTPSLRGFIDAGAEEGYARVSSFATARHGGIGPCPVNVVAGQRQSTAQCYLTKEIRARSNLTISGRTLIDTVAFDGRRATGVISAAGKLFTGSEVILSAGAYGSAAILLRSGIGSAGDLRALGIDGIADLPVGSHLVDQPLYRNAYALDVDDLDMRPATGAMLWTASRLCRPDELDLQITATHLLGPTASPTGGAVVFGVGLMTPESHGRLRLRSRDPYDQPEIDLNLLGSERDRARLLEGVKLSRRIGSNPSFARHTAFELAPGVDVQGDENLAEAVLGSLAVCGNPVASAPMGKRDGSAVVDSDGGVLGVQGLRVIDASIIPEAPTVPANLTVIMLAERLAERLYPTGDRPANAARRPRNRSFLRRLFDPR